MSIFDAVMWGSKSLLLMNISYLFFIRKHLSRSMVLLLVLLLGILGIELISTYLANKSIPNRHITHFYTSGQFLLISTIYFGELKRFKNVVPVGIAIYASVLLYQIFTSQFAYDEFNTVGFLVSACLLMSYALFYYIEHITEKKYWDLYNVGLFLYLGGSSIIFLTMNSWKDLEGWNMRIWTLNGGLIILYQLFITATIYRFHRMLKNQNKINSI